MKRASPMSWSTGGLLLNNRSPSRWSTKRSSWTAAIELDLLVEQAIIVEIKSIDALAPIHSAQLLSYLKLSGYRLGLLINFNVELLKDGGIQRIANHL